MAEPDNEHETSDNPSPTSVPAARRILADGTYATESAFSQQRTSITSIKSAKPPLRGIHLLVLTLKRSC
jgi:hypothetical protein